MRCNKLAIDKELNRTRAVDPKAKTNIGVIGKINTGIGGGLRAVLFGLAQNGGIAIIDLEDDAIGRSKHSLRVGRKVNRQSKAQIGLVSIITLDAGLEPNALVRLNRKNFITLNGSTIVISGGGSSDSKS